MPVALSEVQNIPALRQISERDLPTLAQVVIKRTFAPGEFLFLEGEPAQGIWFILSGQVKIIKWSVSGRVQALCLANRGKCFGTCPLFSSSTNPATAQAIDAVSLLILPQATLPTLIQQNPQLVQILLQIYSERLAQLARLGEALGTWSVGMRINDALLAYADQGVVHLTHEKLAELAGTVREVVSRHLGQLAQRGMISPEPHGITLLQPQALQSACIFDKPDSILAED
jgi:CRP/FNR family transcriptional regulator